MIRSTLFRPPVFARRALGAFALALACALALPASEAAAAAVDVNRAGEAELQTVKGIGPAMSGRILASRTQQGAFKDWADLVQRVPGLGARNAEKLSQAGLNVAGAGFDAAQVAALQPARPARAARGAAADAPERKPAGGAPAKAPVATATPQVVTTP